MTNYRLNTLFTNEQLQMLYATGTNVVIAKPLAGANPNIAWQVFKPFQNNTLEWEEEYGIYVSNSPIANGSIIRKHSSTGMPAVMGKVYTLQESGVITGPENGGAPNGYTLVNNYTAAPYMTVGLFQNAVINGQMIDGNVASADVALSRSMIVMIPATTIYIWLQAQVMSNTVVTNITSPVTKLSFGGSVTDMSVAYDSNTGHFIPTSTLKASSKDVNDSIVSHIEASL